MWPIGKSARIQATILTDTNRVNSSNTIVFCLMQNKIRLLRSAIMDYLSKKSSWNWCVPE